jgi:hypothetical protein
MCIQINTTYNCSNFTFSSSAVSLLGFSKATDTNSISIILATGTISPSRRLLIGPSLDPEKQYILPKEIQFNFPYQSATIQFPNLSTIKITVQYNISLNNLNNFQVSINGHMTQLPDVPDNNLALKFYTDQQYEMADTFSRLVPILSYVIVGLLVLMFVFESKVIALEMQLLFQFTYGGLIMLRKMEVSLYPFEGLWIFNGYAYPIGDGTRVDARVAALGYHADFLSNFNVNLIIYLLPLAVGSLLFVARKVGRIQCPKLERWQRAMLEEWQLTAMLFCLQPLIFAFVINVSYSHERAAGIIIGTVLIVILVCYQYLFYTRQE